MILSNETMWKLLAFSEYFLCEGELSRLTHINIILFLRLASPWVRNWTQVLSFILTRQSTSIICCNTLFNSVLGMSLSWYYFTRQSSPRNLPMPLFNSFGKVLNYWSLNSRVSTIGFETLTSVSSGLYITQ